MELPLVGKIRRPRLWLLGLAGAGAIAVAATAFSLQAGRPRYDLDALTVPVQSAELTLKIRASGTVVPVKSVNVSPKTSGRLMELSVEQGDRVEAGQVVAVMENEEALAQKRQAEANLAEARARLDEAEAGTRVEEIAQARARLEQVRAQLAAANARLPREIDQARAQVASATSRYELASDRLDRNRRLLTAGAIARDRFDESFSEYRTAEALLEEAQERLKQARTTDRPEILRLEASVAEAAANLEQLENGVRAEEMARLRALVAASAAQLQAAEVNYRDTLIQAPFAGIVTQKYATEGAFVTPTTSASSTASATSTSILAIAQGLEILAQVPEVDVGRLSVGQPVEIVADAYPDRAFEGRVTLIAPEAVVEQNVTSFEVRVELLTGLDRLRSGMNVDATFLGETIADALVVPTVAVVTQEGQTGVMVVGDRLSPEFQPVILGTTIDNQTQILQGLDRDRRVFVDLPESYRQQQERSDRQ